MGGQRPEVSVFLEAAVGNRRAQIEARSTYEKAWDAIDDLHSLPSSSRRTEMALVMRTAVNALHKHPVAYIDHKKSEIASGVLVQWSKRRS